MLKIYIETLAIFTPFIRYIFIEGHAVFLRFHCHNTIFHNSQYDYFDEPSPRQTEGILSEP